jgi:cytochrome P450
LLEKLNAAFYHSPTPDVEEQFGRLLFNTSAGSSNTLASMEFAILILMRYPAVRERLRQEIDTVDLETLTYEKLTRLTYLQNFFDELLRLYPSIPFYLPRPAAQPFTLNDNGQEIQIEAGDTVLASPYLTGRSSELYDNPQQFDPDRFDESKRSQYSKANPKPAAFSTGLKKCPGDNLAELEFKIMVFLLL